MFDDAAISCDQKGYKGVAGACECDTGYTGAVNYVNGKPVGCTGRPDAKNILHACLCIIEPCLN